MAVRRTTISITGATGGAGVATATARSDEVVDGEIIAIHREYLDSPPATTDVTITDDGDPAQPVLTVTDSAADGWSYPLYAAVDETKTALNVGAGIRLSGYLVGTIAQANNGDGVTITVVWDDLR